MEAANLHKHTRTLMTAGSGELVLQNGRQAGARRPLSLPTTFIGRNPGCEIRLNVDDVDPLHCLLVFTPDGVQLRDLHSVHGTYVNGERAENVIVRHGDVLKVGPFQFRVELSAALSAAVAAPADSDREALRIQAAAVAAQQAGLEEEEARLHQRRSDLQQQEEQLAAHLDEKQRQVQLWSEYTKAEREALRKEKIEQDKRIARLEQDLAHARQELSKDHQKVIQERQHINKIYQRLRERWKKQWSAEKEKYQKQARKLQTEAMRLEEHQTALNAHETALKTEVLSLNTERTLSARQLQDGRDALTKSQESWRRRRSLEHTALKAKEREIDETQIKLKQARQLLVQEKHAWDRQFDALQKELHGLNNRIVHQRDCVEEQTEEIARLDALLRKRRRQANALPGLAAEITDRPAEEALPECEVIVLAEEADLSEPVESAPSEAWQHRFDGLDRLASELADQRVHLLEQFNRLAELQDVWHQQRDQASIELETFARRLLDQEHSLAARTHQTGVVEALLHQRQQETDAVRQEIQVWRAQLKTRAHIFEQDHQKQMLALRQKETLLQEQATALTRLRERWNRRRLQEVEQMRSQRTGLQEQHKETHALRLAMFEKGQQIEEEKRILAEKALALEQYRQEVFIRAKDPASQRRVERLRRRWLTLNAALIRNAKVERDTTRKTLAELDAQRAQLQQAMTQLTQNETTLAEQQSLLEEREASLKARQLQVENEIAALEGQRRESAEEYLRMQDDVEILAKAVYEEPDAPALDKAA